MGVPLTSQQKSVLIKAYRNGSIPVLSYSVVYPLVLDGTLIRVNGGNTFRLSDAGAIIARGIIEALPLTMDTESDVPLADENGNLLLVDDGTPDKVWLFNYTVTYPRVNKSDWSFTWEIAASGQTQAEASREAEIRIEQIFPGATIG